MASEPQHIPTDEAKDVTTTTTIPAISTATSRISDANQTTPTATQTATPSSTSSPFSSLHSYPFYNDTTFLAGLSQIFGHPNTPVTEAELGEKPDLVLSAKCFYFNRKFKPPEPIDPKAYKTWLASLEGSSSSSTVPQPSTSQQTPPTAQSTSIPQPSTSISASTSIPTERQPTSSTPSISTTQSTTTSTLQPSTDATPKPNPDPNSSIPPPPPYPTSFAAIVDLITNNKPIPGIEEIPDTVLELGSSKQDKATRRRKPWEKEDAEPAEDVAETKTADSNINHSAADTKPDDPVNEVGDVLAETYLETTTGGHEQAYGAEGLSGAESAETAAQDREQGLLRLLRPDAVPDSGLVAKE